MKRAIRPAIAVACLCPALLLAAAIGAARANDSVAVIAAGGLVLSQSAEIEMRAEDLYVSHQRITVKYRFHNRTDKDVVTLVAFPLPEIAAPMDGDIPIAADDPVNFLKFTTSVDGKSVAMRHEQRAVALGLDRSEMLKGLGVPLAPYLQATTAALDALAPDRQARLRELGMIGFQEFDAGKGWERHAHPLWSVRTTFYWTQRFPAGRDVLIEHSYVPAAGGAAQTFLGADFADAAALADYRQRYCIEDSFIKAAERRQRGGKTILSEWTIAYILTTGANWAGSIGDFRLVVDKGAPENLVSFCASGVKKIAPTQFEVRYKDYFPERDLNVLILVPSKLR